MNIGGFPVRNTTAAVLTRFLQRSIRSGKKVAVGFANHHFVTTCQTLPCDKTGGQPFVLVSDGIGVQLAALLRFGRGFAENMNGTDFVPRFLRTAPEPCSVFLIGGRGDVVARAAETISNLPNCRVVGFCDGFSLWSHEETVIREIEALAPDILLVGLGNPIQERWIGDHWPELNARVIIAVGALFEWMTGAKRRAPSIIRRARLEWAYRLVLEPRRLLGRYTIEGLQFLALVLRGGPAGIHRGT